jgi:GNAT superfamily N-acetyltransferase
MATLSSYLTHLSARAAGSGDGDFLLRLYRSTRDDLRALPYDPAVVESLIDLQQRVQAAGHRNSFPHAEHLILYAGAIPVARIVVDTGAAGMRLVDIAVMAEWRRKGIGTLVLRAVQQCASDRQLPLALSVAHANGDAMRLYLAAGFEPGARDDMAQQMIYRPESVCAGMITTPIVK